MAWLKCKLPRLGLKGAAHKALRAGLLMLYWVQVRVLLMVPSELCTSVQGVQVGLACGV